MAQAPLQKNPIVTQCVGCENIEGEYCRIWAAPAAKWRIGVCPSASMSKSKSKPLNKRFVSGSRSREER